MKKTRPRRGLHLVTAEEAARIAEQAVPDVAEPEPEPASQQELDTLIANGIRRYQQLQQEFDRALFAEEQDTDKITEVLPELQLLRTRLASYGIHLRP